MSVSPFELAKRSRRPLGLDMAQAEALARWLKEELRRGDIVTEERRRAALEMGRSVSALVPDLANPLAELATSAIAEATDPSRLRAYAAVIGAVADKFDGAAANALVERVVPAIAGATNPGQLQAYGTVIAAVADKLDGAAARATVERGPCHCRDDG